MGSELTVQNSQCGRLITLEGGEGCGKSTQSQRLSKALAACGVDVVATREPGGTEGAEAIRQMVVEGPLDRWSPLAEALLHITARLDHVQRLVRPSLARGLWVVSDRFMDSTRVYQGFAGGVSLRQIDRLHQEILGSMQPDLTFVLDLQPHVGMSRRLRHGGAGRHERMGPRFHERIREGFHDLARSEPERVVLVNGDRPVDEVTEVLLQTVSHRFGLKIPSRDA